MSDIFRIITTRLHSIFSELRTVRMEGELLLIQSGENLFIVCDNPNMDAVEQIASRSHRPVFLVHANNAALNKLSTYKNTHRLITEPTCDRTKQLTSVMYTQIDMPLHNDRIIQNELVIIDPWTTLFQHHDGRIAVKNGTHVEYLHTTSQQKFHSIATV